MDRQAELMAEAFSAFADNLVTKDYFSEVLEARLRQQSAELEQRIVERMNQRFARLERASFLHTWMLGILVVVLVIPQLQAWLV